MCITQFSDTVTYKFLLIPGAEIERCNTLASGDPRASLRTYLSVYQAQDPCLEKTRVQSRKLSRNEDNFRFLHQVTIYKPQHPRQSFRRLVHIIWPLRKYLLPVTRAKRHTRTHQIPGLVIAFTKVVKERAPYGTNASLYIVADTPMPKKAGYDVTCPHPGI